MKKIETEIKYFAYVRKSSEGQERQAAASRVVSRDLGLYVALLGFRPRFSHVVDLARVCNVATVLQILTVLRPRSIPDEPRSGL